MAILFLIPIQPKSFRSHRTDHLKVRNIVKKSKSGSGATPKLTAKQLFKLNRYAFLNAYQRSRSASSTLGQVNKHNHHEPSCRHTVAIQVHIFAHITLIFPTFPQLPPLPQPSGHAGSRRSKKGSSSVIADVLDAFLSRAAKQDQEMQNKVKFLIISIQEIIGYFRVFTCTTMMNFPLFVNFRWGICPRGTACRRLGVASSSALPRRCQRTNLRPSGRKLTKFARSSCPQPRITSPPYQQAGPSSADPNLSQLSGLSGLFGSTGQTPPQPLQLIRGSNRASSVVSL